MPIITLTTDSGTGSPYVAAIKAVLLEGARDAVIVDVSHEVPPFDVMQGAFVLWLGTRFFGPGAIHVAVIDPGVGTERRPIAIALNDSFYVGPDNGLFGLILQESTQAPTTIVELPRPSGTSATFEELDVFAPTAAALASGRPISELGRPLGGPLLDLTVHEPAVLWVDRFGNLITNLKPPVTALRVNGHTVRTTARTFGEAPAGQPFVYVVSFGLVAIAVAQGRADTALGATAGTALELLT
jgi:S-adenosylmethionine hydrolase